MSPSPRLRSVVVTGAAGGIGAAIAEELGRRGAFVVTLDANVTLDGSAPAEPGSLTRAVLSDPIAPLLSFVFGVQVALAPFVETHPLDDINRVFAAVHHREIKKRAVMVPA